MFKFFSTAPIDRLRTIFQVDSVEANNKDLNAGKVFKQMLKEGNILPLTKFWKRLIFMIDLILKENGRVYGAAIWWTY